MSLPPFPRLGIPEGGHLGAHSTPSPTSPRQVSVYFRSPTRASRPLPEVLSDSRESYPQTTDEKVGLEEVSLPRFHCGGHNRGSGIPNAPAPAPCKTLRSSARDPSRLPECGTLLPLSPQARHRFRYPALEKGFPEHAHPNPRNHPSSPEVLSLPHAQPGMSLSDRTELSPS